MLANASTTEAAAITVMKSELQGLATSMKNFSNFFWTRDGTGTPLDLRGGTFGSDGHLNAYTADGTRCICDLAVIGSQQSGSVALTGCISIPYDPGRDPQCKALQATGTYSKPGDVLTITANGQTSTYR
jgi:hypothetical protein